MTTKMKVILTKSDIEKLYIMVNDSVHQVNSVALEIRKPIELEAHVVGEAPEDLVVYTEVEPVKEAA